MKKKTLFLFLIPFLFRPSFGEPFFNDGLNYPVDLILPHKSSNPSNLAQYLNEKYPIDYHKANEIVRYSLDAANQNQIDPELILAIIAVESTYNPKATSSVGARGLMQVMPQYHSDKLEAIGANPSQLYEVHTNINVGSKIIAEYLDWNDGNLPKALLRYNGSSRDKEQTYANKVLRLYDDFKATRQQKEISAQIKLPKNYYFYSGTMIP